jgi:hypothetical protein
LAERDGRHYPAVDSPDPALNHAAAWAIGRVGGNLRVNPAQSTAERDTGDDALADLLDDARRWHRVGGNAVIRPDDFLARMLTLLWGARLGGAGGRLELCPDLPDSWKSMGLRRLRAHRTLIDLEAKRRAEWMTLRVAVRFGPPIAISAGLPPDHPVSRVTIDEVPVEGVQAVFTAGDEHEVVFWETGGRG